VTTLAVLFLLAAVLAIWSLPRQWAPAPLLATACYMTLGQGIEVAGLSFPIIRLVLLAGVVRAVVRGERPAGGWIGMDQLFLLWASWAVLSGLFHENPLGTLENRLGMAYNALCAYYLLRSFCQVEDDVYRTVRIIAWILLPVALEMVNEQITGLNLYSMFGGVPGEAVVRNGRIRSQGPFAHAILAGTVGAVTMPILVGLWQRHPATAKVGIIACGLIVLASASSGPLMSLAFGVFALFLWRYRYWTREIRIVAVIGYILLELVMKAPAYYLIARIDLAGGSTGWHRARLIESSIEHLHEWWAVGTDYTHHWMPTGVPWNPNHTDITNHYLEQGVRGGLPLTLLFIMLLWCGFRYVGQSTCRLRAVDSRREFFTWAVGAGLLAHAATMVSVSYFDQSELFLYLNLALSASLYCAIVISADPALAAAEAKSSMLAAQTS
jgi:hypothetical protein